MESDRAKMPPPETPRQSPAQKRKTSSVSLTVQSFADTVKLAAKEMTNNECWNCRAKPVQVAHVVGIGDGQYELWVSLGLLEFNPKSVLNAIALCGVCHPNFDDAWDPGLMILPSDLKFFIEWEERDYKDRVHKAQQGTAFPRVSPTREHYRDFQAQQGLVAKDSDGALYDTIYLKDYCPNLSKVDSLQPRLWHGNPMAMLRHAIGQLGTLRLSALGSQKSSQLQKLQRLYMRPAPAMKTPKRKRGNSISNSEVEAAEKQGDRRSKRLNKGLTEASLSQSNSVFQPASKSTDSQETFVEEWVLGPQSSSRDAALRFGKLVAEDNSLLYEE